MRQVNFQFWISHFSLVTISIQPTAQYENAVARLLYSVILVRKRAGWRHTLTLHVFFCVGAYSRKTYNRKNNLLFWFGKKTLSTEQANVYRHATATRCCAKTNRYCRWLTASSHTLLAHTDHRSKQHGWFCSEKLCAKPERARCCCCYCLPASRPVGIGRPNQPGERGAAGELFPASLHPTLQTTAVWWICCLR